MNTILSNHPDLISKRGKTISFEKDFEGKRLLNAEVNKLYKKNIIISDQEFINIVIDSYVIIQKMNKIQNCNWDISELKAHLSTGINYYYENNTHVNQIPPLIKKTANNQHQEDIRKKFPAELKTSDGHYVRSKAEMIIYNFLYINNIVHSYEKRLPIDEEVYCDFYIPSSKDRPQGVYIEFWGLNNDEKYLERKRFKIDIYKKYKYELIEIVEDDISNLEEVLTKKLLQYQIKIY